MIETLYKQNFDAKNISLEENILQSYQNNARQALISIKNNYHSKNLSLLQLPGKASDIKTIETIAAHYCDNFDDVIILGTGGSSLGSQAICAAARSLHSSGPKIHFVDNIDPKTFEKLFNNIKPQNTGLIVISKSGQTIETLTQFLHCLNVFRVQKYSSNLTLDIKKHFTIITGPKNSPLRKLAKACDLKIIDSDPSLGGRYSALAISSLLPPLIAGVDAYEIRSGALAVLENLLKINSVEDCPPAIGAILNVALAKEKTINTTVLMCYLDQLKPFGAWFQQLWAESLGKKGQGTTPLYSIGTVDQHSQLQLYLDGPKDKFFTILFADQKNKGGLIPADLTQDSELKFIENRTMGDLMAAEQSATISSLVKNGCPTRTIELKLLDEPTVGALIMHFILETIIAADLLGIDAFNQPAVDEGKTHARELMENGDIS